MMLKNKNTVIYGAGGAVGGAVARAFAREGAHVFLAGCTNAALEAVAADISATGGKSQVMLVDALDAQAVDHCVASIAKETRGIDVSFNAIGLGDTQGTSLTEMTHDSFASPIVNAMATHFFTATAAARQMVKQGAGVILAITAQCGRKPYPNVGGFGVACAAIEGFCRQLAVEVGSQGVRVVCLRSSGSPDAPGVDEVIHRHARNAGISRERFEAELAEGTLLKRLPKLAELANVAVFMASDRASAITGAVANVTCGEIVD